jgi:hypothetical protein
VRSNVRKSLVEHVRDGSFRSERHGHLLVTDPPLPAECPQPTTAFPALGRMWQSMVELQADARRVEPDARADVAVRFARICGEYCRLRERAAGVDDPADVIVGLRQVRDVNRYARAHAADGVTAET